MKVCSSSLELLQIPDSDPGAKPMGNRPFLHLTVGNFDGLHLGHQALLQQAESFRQQYGGLLSIYSFDPHPQVFFRPHTPHIFLENRETWRDRLKDYKVDILIEEKFTKEFSLLSPEEFLNTYWGPFLNLKSLTVGSDFRFGRDRKGDTALLGDWCAKNNIEFRAIPPVLVDNERVSTTRIKELLQTGDVERAAQCLGRPFSIRSKVVKGDQRGRLLGFPTLNQIDAAGRLLKRGVYVSEVSWNGKSFHSITNVGIRPTVESAVGVVVETHILSFFDREIYGETVEVRFLKFLREERKFSGLDELKQQIQIDVELARRRDKL